MTTYWRIPTSGGKAGKGHNKTSGVQVLRDGLLIKNFRFTVGDDESRDNALLKAIKLVKSLERRT